VARLEVLRWRLVVTIMGMMSDELAYRERRSTVEGVTVWARVADGSTSLVLPDGCIDVLWNGADLMVAGPDTTAHRAVAPSGTSFTALRFASGIAPSVFGVAADRLRDERFGLGDVIGAAEATRLTESLLATSDPAGELESWVSHRLLQVGGPDRTMGHVAALIGAGKSVSEVADQIGFSERQLHRRSLGAFGYGPKVLARVLRLQRALGLARSGIALTHVAAAAGYGDHAYFAHEARALTGQTPSQLAGSDANRSTPLPSGSRNVA
jgi:AraC-like DNA-binding protein